jgi:hypothetical protein
MNFLQMGQVFTVASRNHQHMDRSPNTLASVCKSPQGNRIKKAKEGYCGKKGWPHVKSLV